MVAQELAEACGGAVAFIVTTAPTGAVVAPLQACIGVRTVAVFGSQRKQLPLHHPRTLHLGRFFAGGSERWCVLL